MSSPPTLRSAVRVDCSSQPRPLGNEGHYIHKKRPQHHGSATANHRSRITSNSWTAKTTSTTITASSIPQHGVGGPPETYRKEQKGTAHLLRCLVVMSLQSRRHISHSGPVVKGQGSQLIGGLSTWGLFTFDKVRGMGV